jgi:hypothetical protein
MAFSSSALRASLSCTPQMARIGPTAAGRAPKSACNLNRWVCPTRASEFSWAALTETPCRLIAVGGNGV